MKPRSSLIEQGLVVISILGAMVLAVMALVVHRVNSDAAEAGKHAIRAIEIAATLDKLQLALRDGDVAARDLLGGRARARTDADHSDLERYDAARFQARLSLAALGPLTGDEPGQSERLSRLVPLVGRQMTTGPRGVDAATAGTRDEVDALIAAMRDEAGEQLQADRVAQGDANRKSTTILVASLALVSLFSLAFWMLLKIEFKAHRALEARLIESATIDELTGVANRSDLDHKLVQEWAFRNRYATALSLLVVDVDHLKQHNEQYGHIAGDAILREVARRLGTRLRRNELLARSGGDEFAIIVPQFRREALVLAERLRELVAEAAFSLPGAERSEALHVTISIGVAEASDVDAPRDLLAAATVAVDAAKQRGCDRVESYRSDTTIGAPRTVTGRDRPPTTLA